MAQLTYQTKCKDVMEKTVGEGYGGKDGKYKHGLIYLPKDWIGRKVHIILEPEE